MYRVPLGRETRISRIRKLSGLKKVTDEQVESARRLNKRENSNVENDMESDEIEVPSAPGWPVLLVRKRGSSHTGSDVERLIDNGQCLASRQMIIG